MLFNRKSRLNTTLQNSTNKDSHAGRVLVCAYILNPFLMIQEVLYADEIHSLQYFSPVANLPPLICFKRNSNHPINHSLDLRPSGRPAVVQAGSTSSPSNSAVVFKLQIARNRNIICPNPPAEAKAAPEASKSSSTEILSVKSECRR